MTDTTTSPRDEELNNQINEKLYRFADYIRHHYRTGLGGSDNQNTIRNELTQLIHAHDATREREILQLVGTAGAHACYCSYSTSDCSCALTDSLRAATNQLPNDVKEGK